MRTTKALQKHIQTFTQNSKKGAYSVSALLKEVDRLRHEIERQDERIETLKRQALEDPLTSLPNRRHFERELQASLSLCKRHLRTGALLLIDVNAFKSINDTLGHLAGDAILKHLATILQKNVRSTDVVARLGGDEFCIILKEVSQDEASRKLEEIHNAVISSPCSYQGKEIHVSVSVGLCLFGDEATREEVLEKADKSMYSRKHGNVVMFEKA